MSHSSLPRWSIKDSLWFFGSLLLAGQWVVVHTLRIPLASPWDAILPGLAIFGAAFLLSWGAELSQLEISQALALAFLALMAVLPEYAVDLYLAWTAAKDPSYTAYAAANMTGANRILIGFGWPIILLCYWAKTKIPSIQVAREQRIELSILLIATLYAFLIPLKRTLSLLDTAVLLAIFAVYIIQSGKSHHTEPELEGSPAYFATWSRAWRRLLTIALFLLPGATIFMSAEPFAEGLLHSARGLGIEEFILIQWLAPLASESPEFIVAILFSLKGHARAGLGTLISSKVNQWTLLVGMLPLAYAISAGRPFPMHLDGRQAEEMLLTASQSLLAIVILSNWQFGLGEALLLLGLFTAQLLIPVSGVRWGFSFLYLALAIGTLVARRSYREALLDLLKNGWRTPPRNK